MLRAFIPLALWSSLPASARASFDAYLRQFGKSYSPEEYRSRKAVFEQRASEIEKQNGRLDATWVAGLNDMTDWLPTELAQRRGYNKRRRQADPAAVERQVAAMSKVSSSLELPDDLDWREYKPSVVTAVKSQGGCGTSWAFSAAATIESHVALNTGILTELSPQHLATCAPLQDGPCSSSAGGCSGATPQLAFSYTREVGLDSAADRPPTSGGIGGVQLGAGACGDDDEGEADIGIAGYEALPANDAQELALALATVGPISVSVDASSWHVYKGGIFDACNRSSPDVNHAVQLVGFGQDKGTKYWLVRNSWGPSWGEDGYIRLRRHDIEPCGTGAAAPGGGDDEGCEGSPQKTQVCGECGLLWDASYPTGVFVTDSYKQRLAAKRSPIHI